MPNPTTPKIFKKSLLAVAVLSISGCASAPKMNDVDLSPIGEGILVAGRATAEVGIHAWDVGMYLLGFSDEAGTESSAQLVNPAKGPFPIDDVDLALLEEDALPAGDALIPLDIASATANYGDILIGPSSDPLAKFRRMGEPDPLLIQPEMENVEVLEVFEISRLPTDNVEADLVVEASEPALPVLAEQQDYIHTVATNENLWDIAKATTGDATNWHELADVNDLNQNAGVFAGQELIIPADMVKPELIGTGIQSLQDDSVASNSALIIAPTESISDEGLVMAAAETDAATTRLEIPAVAQTNGTPVKLNPGETLWDFAKRTTGDATNWQAIAGHNGFSEKQAVTVRAGQTILVPEDIVKSDVALASAQPTADEAATTAARAEVLAAIEKVNQTAVDASSELLAEASSLGNESSFSDETQPITIVEANFQADPSQQRIQMEPAPIEIVKMQAPDLNQIMVSGTYYPKAIYNDADFSSSLLMRVSPGTSLKVSKAVGNWFEVETERGTGYVHQRDIK